MKKLSFAPPCQVIPVKYAEEAAKYILGLEHDEDYLTKQEYGWNVAEMYAHDFRQQTLARMGAEAILEWKNTESS
jgi:hypothetical protein